MFNWLCSSFDSWVREICLLPPVARLSATVADLRALFGSSSAGAAGGWAGIGYSFALTLDSFGGGANWSALRLNRWVAERTERASSARLVSWRNCL